MEFHEKATAIRSATRRLGEARSAHRIAAKVHNDAKVWRRYASEDERLWELETRIKLENAMCEVKAIEAELRRIKLAKLH
jgi:hypothetical protein